ncbi:MAG TPA: hypothetical protein VM123_18460 [archaeon]|nr:hypothetical protein [archaeon]
MRCARIFVVILSIALFCIGFACNKNKTIFDRPALHAQAVDESLIPVRPGIPGKSPFWNINSSRFIYVPSFDFNPVEGAARYRFTARSEADKKEYVFEAREPWATLKPVWKELPVGYVSLTVEGLDDSGLVAGTAGTRYFYRAAVFNGPYHKPALDYQESTHRGLQYLFNLDHFQRWKTQGTPDPAYSLYCYPSKMISAVIRGMLLYAELAPESSEDAKLIAENAAKYLIRVSEPAGAPLEFFPPTYDAYHIDNTLDYKDDIDLDHARESAKKYEGQVMLTYAADAANAYLDLYEKNGDSTFFNAAKRIADTYAKIQLLDGNWPLKMDTRTGKPVVENYAQASGILSLFRCLEEKYSLDNYEDNLELAEKERKKPFEDFNFEGQFEDVEPSKRYMNLTHYTPIDAARHFFDQAGEKPENLAKAEELLRFAEDQFVVWERPIPKPRPDREWMWHSDEWITPCALEQYECYVPVDASAASFISIFYKAYQATGKKLYLAKALSLANSMTIAQDPDTGRYPTWWGPGRNAPGWINCAVADAHTMLDFGKKTAELELEY